MKINDYILNCKREKRYMPKIFCADGTILSVQAGEGWYSNPREFSPVYKSVEVGYPTSQPPESWREYMDDEPSLFDNYGTSTVYGYVPVGLVDEYIQSHGGIVNTPGKEACGFCGTWNLPQTSCISCGHPM